MKSWSVVQRAGHPAWQERTPYVVGVVALEEGPSMLTHLWVDQKDLAYQKEVEISYEEINQHVLPFFKPRSIE
ncbi:OB-fold domain-containing protein [Gracilibacillus sp. JCM 18860]|uniref:OB-fold domain-containing protein n=1 Tax=Gracilibacillus sp. JCM 18860 TaxID=1306159 RepID=UPI003260D860